MEEKQPDVMAGSTNKYQSWEICDPEKWVPDGYVCVRVDSRGCGRSPGYVEHWSPRETKDFYNCIEWAGRAAVVERQGRPERHLLLRHQPVAGREPCSRSILPPSASGKGFADFYRELSHNGGIYNTFAQNWYDMQVKTVQYGLGTKGHRSRMNGDWVSGPETLTDEADGRQPLRSRQDLFRASARRRFLQGDVAGLVEGQGADALGRELGRTAAASARQFRGLLPIGVETEMARSARHRALDALLHRLRGRTCRRSSSAISSRARRTAGTSSRACSSTSVIRARNSSSATRTIGRSRARNGPNSTWHATATSWSTERAEEFGDGDVRRARRRRHFPHRADARGDRDHRTGGRQAAHLIVDRGRRHLPRAARVLARHEGSRVPGCARPAHADRARLAARLASQARQEADAAVPALPHPRRKAAAQARTGLRTRYRDHPDLHRRAERAIAWR